MLALAGSRARKELVPAGPCTLPLHTPLFAGSHRQLLGEVWGPAYAGQTHYLRVYMAQLRHELERDPARPQMLITGPRVGYRLKGA